MSFVVEEIKTAEQIAEFQSFGLKSPFNGEPMQPWRWAVDRQRGWYFFSFGGGASEIPWIMALFNRDGLVVNIEGRQKSKGLMQPKSVKVWWTLECIGIPNRHADRADELVRLVHEALRAWGPLGESDLTKAVHIKSTAPGFY